MTDETGWVPDACTLPTAEQPLRRAEFDALFATAVERGDRISATHLRLTMAASEAAVRDLAARENGCCAFFTFTIGVPRPDRVQLDVEVPAAYTGVLDALARRADAVGPAR